MPGLKLAANVDVQPSTRTNAIDVQQHGIAQQATRKNVSLCRQAVVCVCILLAAPASAFVSPLLPGSLHQTPRTPSAMQSRVLLSPRESSFSTKRRATFQHRKLCVSMKKRGDVDDVEVLRIALDQKRNEELMGGHLMGQDIERLRKYALAVTEQRSPVACDALGRGGVLEGRWRLALSSEFISLLPSADIFMDVDCKRRQLQYVLHFRGRYLLLQKLKLISSYDFLQGGSLLAMLFSRIVLVIASKPVSLPLPAGPSSQARRGSSVSVMRYHGPREGESALAEEEEEKERRRKLNPVARALSAVRGGWSVFWRLSALAAVTLAGLAVIVPPLVVCYCAAAVVMAFSPFKGQHKDDSMPKRRLHRA